MSEIATPTAPAKSVGERKNHEHEPCVQGIDAIMIHAENPETLSEWYATHLGVRTLRENDGNYYGGVSDRQAGKTVHIGIYGSADTAAADGRAVMVNYRVDDFDDFVAGLRERGVEIEKIVEESFGYFAYFRDGEGNRLEVWSPKK